MNAGPEVDEDSGFDGDGLVLSKRGRRPKGTGKIPGPEYVEMSLFDGKDCSEIEAIRWVGKVMGMHGVKPEACPSAAAWNLLNHCRSDPEFMKTFWSSMYVKAIRLDKVGVIEDDEKKRDGARTVELCNRLLKMSKELGG